MGNRDGFLKSIRNEIFLCNITTSGHGSLGKSQDMNLSSKRGGGEVERKKRALTMSFAADGFSRCDENKLSDSPSPRSMPTVKKGCPAIVDYMEKFWT